VRGLEFPNFSLSSNLSIAGLGQAGWTRLFQYPMNHSLTASVAKVTPRHTIKSGGECRRLHDQLRSIRISSGSFNFDRGWTQQEINKSTPSVPPWGRGWLRFCSAWPRSSWKWECAMTRPDCIQAGLAYETRAQELTRQPTTRPPATLEPRRKKMYIWYGFRRVRPPLEIAEG
jgi:hypothetical protein